MGLLRGVILIPEYSMKIPRHIAIIMDGNRRWAEKRGLPVGEGHKAGVKAVRRVIRDAMALGIEYLTLYAFSVDNWKRSRLEVTMLMRLMRAVILHYSKEFKDNGIRLIWIGTEQGMDRSLVSSIKKIVEKTKQAKKFKLIIALNYGGRTEIVDAVKKVGTALSEGKISLREINENLFTNYLYTSGIPDPDLLIRTSGEMRVSNFLLWQISYTELWATPIYWPDFGRAELVQAIEEFNKRQRRFGGRPNADQKVF